MPSPFPGMDPFLEHPAFFHSLRQAMIASLREQIQPLLPEPYYADMEDRTWIEACERHREPDVNVLRGDGGVAVAETMTTKPIVIRIPHIERHEAYLNIYARLDDREQVITTIEILSRTNKTPGEHGRDLYVQKQHEVLEGKTHLVEIDLLRGGEYSTAIPLNYLRAGVPSFDYHACIKYFDNVEDHFIYAFSLAERLPILAVPLLPGDGFVPLDLQKALDRAYDTGPYYRRVRYTDPVPAPALTAEQSAWVRQLLRGKGLVPEG
jgi:hypothetical protein